MSRQTTPHLSEVVRDLADAAETLNAERLNVGEFAGCRWAPVMPAVGAEEYGGLIITAPDGYDYELEIEVHLHLPPGNGW